MSLPRALPRRHGHSAIAATYYRGGTLARRGFTLIELMVVVAIVAILAAIAIPSYNEQVRKSRRAEAASELARLHMAQERWRADRPTYGTLAQIGGVATMPNGYYTISVATPGGNCASGVAASNANSFSITATAAGAQLSDTRCATMTLTSLCGTVTKTSTGGGQCW
jgi:type IV pilus assembly protein PilE